MSRVKLWVKLFCGDYPSWWYQWSGWSPLWPWLLLPLSGLYMVLSHLRNILVKPRAVSVPVVCVGNLAVGGVGKTPILSAIVSALYDSAVKVHVIGHGYRGRQKAVHQVNIECDTAELVGDEALLLAAYAPVWVGGTRYQRAQAAIKAGAELLITDDGWQDPALAKDYILAVLDDEYPFGNGWRLPLGPLRQSPLMLQQADQIIRVGNDYQNLERGRDTLNAITVRRSSYWSSQPQAVRQAIIFCGIGQAGQFFAAARALCDQSHITVVDCVRFPDHHLFTSEELSALQQKCSEAALVTTRKDWYRLSAKWLSRVNVIDLRLVWETDQQPADLVKQLMNLRP